MKIKFSRYDLPDFEIIKPFGKWVHELSMDDIILKYLPVEHGNDSLWFVLDKDKFNAWCIFATDEIVIEEKSNSEDKDNVRINKRYSSIFRFN